jgi:hypothetical protein
MAGRRPRSPHKAIPGSEKKLFPQIGVRDALGGGGQLRRDRILRLASKIALVGWATAAPFCQHRRLVDHELAVIHRRSSEERD